ncbi:hypothetical protein L596_000531 [Steinernema carpocapsae]|uniref:SLC12A transporter C-terminal domain-containing protein n=1 Tax=Steinernema carpocapsae TaxID=34508 RepID=A0A4U8UJ32_STECR|nr:hypothetical protein L596_000531 [Steinernema carpocapsae]
MYVNLISRQLYSNNFTTLPVPRAEITTNALYMAWLDLMTRDLPPVLMVRDNQTSVITFIETTCEIFKAVFVFTVIN